MPAIKGHKGNPTGKGGFKPGKSGNPSGRPKGALSNADVVSGIIEGLKKATSKKDGISAITAAINDDIGTGVITKSDAVGLLAKFMPKELGGPGGKDLFPSVYDLSKLSTAELLTFKELHSKIEIKGTANE